MVVPAATDVAISATVCCGVFIALVNDRAKALLSRRYCEGMVSGWRLGHVVTHGVFAVRGEMNFATSVIGGICWELFELASGVATGNVRFWTSGGPTGCMLDVVANTVGFAAGSLLVGLCAVFSHHTCVSIWSCPSSIHMLW